uniref:FMP27/BLTP2/Hobbit GFWDK motif-containing RBG unit domain-containing protein n=1 Tax=Amphimedon queenslandica TaxID=400682 RepID=A0A1X7V154_AMPQE
MSREEAFLYELRGIKLRLRWFNSSTFVKFCSISVDHVQFQLKAIKKEEGEIETRKKKRRSSVSQRRVKIKLKQRLVYKAIRWLAKVAEFNIGLAEFAVQTGSNTEQDEESISFIDLIQADRGMRIILQPLTEHLISVEVMLHQLAFESFASKKNELMDGEALLDGHVSCKVLLHLSLLAEKKYHSLQISLSSLFTQFHGSRSLVLLSKRFRRKAVPNSTSSTPPDLSQLLPNRTELVLDKGALNYEVDGQLKFMYGTLNKSCLTIESDKSTLSVRGIALQSSVTQEVIKIREILLKYQSLSNGPEVAMAVNSVKTCVKEGELMYWKTHFHEVMRKIKTLSTSPPSPLDMPNNNEDQDILNWIHRLPVAMVTKLEVSDFVTDFEVDKRELSQGKGPFASLVCVGGIIKLTRSEEVLNGFLQLKNSYIHLSSLGHTPRPDDPEVLPLTSFHVWGRVLSLGSGTLVLNGNFPSGGDNEGEELNPTLNISGSCVSMVTEISDVTLSTLFQLTSHFRRKYFPPLPPDSETSDRKTGQTSVTSLDETDHSKRQTGLSRLASLVDSFSFTVDGFNALIYEDREDPSPPLLLCIRLDSLSSKNWTANCYRIGIDEQYSLAPYFQCVSACNLPNGGLLDIDHCSLSYEQNDVQTRVNKVVINWNTCSHFTLFHLISAIKDQLNRFRTSIKKTETHTKETETHSEEAGSHTEEAGVIKTDSHSREVLLLGDKLKQFLSKLSLSLHFEVEEGTVNFHLTKAKLSLSLLTSHCMLQKERLAIDAQILKLIFDEHDLLTVTSFLCQCPYHEESLDNRYQSPSLEVKENTVISLLAADLTVCFPYRYKFYAAYEMLTALRKFVLKYHRGSDNNKEKKKERVLVPLDILVEVEKVTFIVEDDWFEVKMRANYVLMLDEYQQRVGRIETLNEKLRRIQDTQGPLSQVSGKRLKNLFDSLEEKNDNVYCQRAREMYTTEQPLESHLLSVSLHQTRLYLMFDPSLLGREALVKQIRDIDPISPLPEDYQFSTLWGLQLSLINEHTEVQLRDYSWKLLELDTVGVSGKLVFAEQEATDDECVSLEIPVGSPWQHGHSVSKLTPLKYYHDIIITVDTIEASWGPSFDPSFAQLNYCFNYITKPSRDPSKPLPWWDKLRLLLHGRAKLITSQLLFNVLASLDPYNTSEFMELRLLDIEAVLLDNVSLSINGGLHGYVHTASRYDECQFFTIPSVSLDLQFLFKVRGESPHLHHSVVRCASNRISDENHDSYLNFRSQSIDLKLSLVVNKKEESQPEVLLYASTLRWLQSCVDIIRGYVSRPIKKGTVHSNMRPKKIRFTRHLNLVDLVVTLPPTLINYWSSVRKQEGLEFTVNGLSLKMQYSLTLQPLVDGLVRRPRANWGMMACEGVATGLKGFTCIKRSETEVLDDDPYVIMNPATLEDERLEKHFLIELASLSYVWQSQDDEASQEEFTHKLKIVDTCFLWNNDSRSVVYKIQDTYKLHKRLKQDLSTDALKSILTQTGPTIPEATPTTKDPSKDPSSSSDPSPLSSDPTSETTDISPIPPTRKKSRPRLHRNSSGCMMLDQLLADICNTIVVSDEKREASDPKLKGIVAANHNDVMKHDWFIELTNTQVALQGVEVKGYVICCSYVAQVFGRDHHPQLREGDLVSKRSWIAKVQDLQYFATMGAPPNNVVPWLPRSVIQPSAVRAPSEVPSDKESAMADLLSQLGPDTQSIGHPIGESLDTETSLGLPGEAVGGVISSIPSQGLYIEDQYGSFPLSFSQVSSSPSVPLQRIASRCHCQMFYITFGGQVSQEDCPAPLSPAHEKMSSSSEAVDTFTFRYPLAEVHTTSEQYSLILDILNKLLLYKEPRRKEATEQHARMNFTLQLTSVSDIRKPVLALQNRLRQTLKRLKTLENDLYIELKSGTDSTLQMRDTIEKELGQTKDALSQGSLELRAMIRAFKEKRFEMSPSHARTDRDVSPMAPEPVRRIEVWLDDAQWSLMQDDGQLKISTIQLTNFSYNRVTFNDDSGEHRLELGSFRVKNCIPNVQSIFQEVLSPYDPASRRLRVDKNVSLRIFCRDRPRVAGISVTEHLEINVVPLAVRLTEKLYQTIQAFFLPKAETEAKDTAEPDHSHVFGYQPTLKAQGTDTVDGGTFSRSSSTRRIGYSSTTPSVVSAPGAIASPPESPHKDRKIKRKTKAFDEVTTMQTRASNIKTFVYVKIPQVTLCITFKGDGISVKEMHEQLVTIPTLQYHDLNVSWQDLLLEIKKDYKRSIISQTIKSVIGMKESEEKAGLSSPKIGRSDLMGRIKQDTKVKSKRIFGKRSGEESIEEDSKTDPLHLESRKHN